MENIPLLYAGMADEYVDDRPYDHMDDDDAENEMEMWLDEDLCVYLNGNGTIVQYFIH